MGYINWWRPIWWDACVFYVHCCNASTLSLAAVPSLSHRQGSTEFFNSSPFYLAPPAIFSTILLAWIKPRKKKWQLSKLLIKIALDNLCRQMIRIAERCSRHVSNAMQFVCDLPYLPVIHLKFQNLNAQSEWPKAAVKIPFSWWNKHEKKNDNPLFEMTSFYVVFFFCSVVEQYLFMYSGPSCEITISFFFMARGNCDRPLSPMCGHLRNCAKHWRNYTHIIYFSDFVVVVRMPKIGIEEQGEPFPIHGAAWIAECGQNILHNKLMRWGGINS